MPFSDAHVGVRDAMRNEETLMQTAPVQPGASPDGTPERSSDPHQLVQRARASGRPSIHLILPDRLGDLVRCHIAWPAETPMLADVVPLFEQFGLRVSDHRTISLEPTASAGSALDAFGLRLDVGAIDAERLPLVEEALIRAWSGDIERDRFNRLVLAAGLGWRDVVLIRAAFRYLRQAILPYSQGYVEDTLLGHPEFVREMVDLFTDRFDPETASGTRAGLAMTRLEEHIERAVTLDEDRILRGFRDFVVSVVRTNWFRRDHDGDPRQFMAFKLDPSRLPGLPLPVPLVETYVYAPQVEGLHLRGGRVARGGIRWSSRPEDFRTEVLALMKAQMVKNAVIVPAGAKGAFVVKTPLAELDGDRAAGEVRYCYATFIRGLLDVTDNLVDGRVVPPPDTVVHDGADSYLVVAADKGTATFSDLANDVAREYRFWLGDAFASGGSAGYDHKAMGITARGTWVSVRRHFHEQGLDVDRDDITVVGIGDMSGDVFGNGMLLSRHVRLVGAFDHRHVFLDPDPDPEISYAERQRLFGLSASSWADYDPTRLSPGGGVFPRTAKSIPLSPPVRARLDMNAEALAPHEVIRALLRAPVDLLWNGGIGTYVKGSTESHSDAGDPVNDAVRVDASTLRCKVVGEGGNLGLTQRARVEYALAGGCINTDFIDNSSGVDTSDLEVNLKILLDGAAADGALDAQGRDELLTQLTDDVAAAVLADNRLQTQAISAAEAQAPFLLDQHSRLMRNLEEQAGLVRNLEDLPTDEEISRRRSTGRGLVRPEIAVLLAYSKNLVRQELVDSDVPDSPALAGVLHAYFPRRVRERFAQRITRHPLAREIIATQLANDLINHVGPGFLYRLEERTGARTPDAARAYAVARDVFQLEALSADIDASADRTSWQTQLRLLREQQRLLEQGASWLLRHRRLPLDIAAEVARFRTTATRLTEALGEMLSGSIRERSDHLAADLVTAGVAPALARRVAALAPLAATFDVAAAAGILGAEPEPLAFVYFRLGEDLDLHWLAGQIVDQPTDSHWVLMAKAALRDDLGDQQRALTVAVLGTSVEDSPTGRVAAWLELNRDRVARFRALIAELRSAQTLDVAMLSVALQELRTLAQAGLG
jgi:glutamate dehydrogenase